MYHTSPNKINEGTITSYGLVGDCLFFSDEIWIITKSCTYYVYEADFECVRASKLHDDHITTEIAEYFGCDLELAESFLNASESEWGQDFECYGDDSWWLQRKRGECAAKMGYDGCEDEDEQGTVYIVPMRGREKELRLVKEHE